MTEPDRGVIVGVDTHADTHTAVVLDDLGRVLGTQQFPATVTGEEQLLRWAQTHGRCASAGVEGTGSYGAQLGRSLRGAGITVVEVNRPNRQRRRRRGKSDPTDAENAARAVLSGEATAIPKNRDGIVESIRVLRVTRRGAIKARTQTANQIKDLATTAPEPLRRQLQGRSTPQRVALAARWRPAKGPDPVAATRRALRSLARRYNDLTAEITALDHDLRQLVTTAAPNTLTHLGVGIDVAGQLLTTVGDNIDRLHSEAALAALCGTNPIAASSGKTTRHRLNRGGDRHANAALYTIAIVRLAHDPATRDYAQQRRTQGKTTRDIIRNLKRYITRELYPDLKADLHHATHLT